MLNLNVKRLNGELRECEDWTDVSHSWIADKLEGYHTPKQLISYSFRELMRWCKNQLWRQMLATNWTHRSVLETEMLPNCFQIEIVGLKSNYHLTWASSMRWTIGHVLSNFIVIKRIFEKNGPGGRVVSAANWQAGVPEFDSSQLQNFFQRNPKSRTIRCLSFWIKFEF